MGNQIKHISMNMDEVLRRADNWQPAVYFLSDEIIFSSIDVTLSVADIYYQINNSDMQTYLAGLQADDV